MNTSTATAATAPTAGTSVAQDSARGRARTRAANPPTPAEAVGATPAPARVQPIPSLACSGPRADLSWALGLVTGAAAVKATLPVLANVLIRSEGEKLTLVATDLEVAVTVRLDGWTFEREGATTLPAKLLSDVMAGLPGDTVALAVDGRAESTRIVCGAFEANLKGIAAEEFPVIPTISTVRPMFRIPARDLVSTIEAVAIAASSNSDRPVLTGVCIRLDGTRAAFAASDGLRLSERVITLDAPAAKQELIVPARALFEAAKVFKGRGLDDEVAVVVTAGQVLFHTARTDIVVRRLDGVFPAYERIIPVTCASRMVLETAELKQAVRLAIASASGNVLRLTLAPGADVGQDTLTLTARAAEVGDNRSVVAGTLTHGEGGQLALSARLLAAVLDCITTAQVALEIQAGTQPIVLRPIGDDAPRYLHLIMPMTIS